jgi:hypothetical protein
MEEPMNDRHLPKTDSIEELAQFWDTHDVTDFEDELEEVMEPIFGPRCTIRIHFNGEDAEAIHRLAQSKGVSDEELVQTWVSEKLRAS